MTKADLLRASDMRAAYRLVRQCRDLGSAPEPWVFYGRSDRCPACDGRENAAYVRGAGSSQPGLEDRDGDGLRVQLLLMPSPAVAPDGLSISPLYR
jgi:hypothetical protein